MAIQFTHADLIQAQMRVRSAASQLPECVTADESRDLRAAIESLREAIEDLESDVTLCDLNDLERTS